MLGTGNIHNGPYPHRAYILVEDINNYNYHLLNLTALGQI